jgi:hypothetical protein
MKKKLFIYGALFLASFTIGSCGQRSKKVDVCRCLTEPGNSAYMQENSEACRDAISKEIGVDNWETVNMSQDLDASARFDALARRCQ